MISLNDGWILIRWVCNYTGPTQLGMTPDRIYQRSFKSLLWLRLGTVKKFDLRWLEITSRRTQVQHLKELEPQQKSRHTVWYHCDSWIAYCWTADRTSLCRRSLVCSCWWPGLRFYCPWLWLLRLLTWFRLLLSSFTRSSFRFVFWL